MMIPVGPTAPITNSEDSLPSGDLNTNAEGTGEEHPFDSTLEDLLAESEIDQAILEDILETEGFAIPLASTFMTQDMINTDILVESNKSSDSLTTLTQLLKKADPILQDEFTAIDPRISIKDITGMAGTIKGQGISESGLQTGFDDIIANKTSLKEGGLDVSGALAQKVLHPVEPLEAEMLTEKKLQEMMQQRMQTEDQGLEAVQETMAKQYQSAGMVRPGEAIKEINSVALNYLSSLASKETKISGDVKSTVDIMMPTAMTATSESSTSSVFRGTESSVKFSESFQPNDLPFEMEQVVGRVRILRGNGTEEMTLRLHPEELGQVTLKIRQSGGELKIDMRVDNPQAKLLIENGFDSLRSRFLDQEFAYQDLALNVDVGQRDSQFENNQDDSEFQDGVFSERGANEEEAPVNGISRMRSQSDSGLNLYV